MNDTQASKTQQAIEEFKFWVMGVNDRRTAVAELCALERKHNLPQSIVQELLQHIKSYFPTIPPVSIKVEQEDIEPESFSMAKTLRNMRATGITRREIPVARISPNQRETARGIPAVRGTDYQPPPKPARKASLVYGTPDRVSSYSMQDCCAEERIF